MTLDDLIPKLAEKAAATAPIGRTLCFDMGTRQLYLDGTGSTNTLAFENKPADCMITVSEADLVALASGKLNPMAAVMGGKVKIKGDMGVAMKLSSLFGS
jgi:acyl-CoA dehydrogenase